jgi:predicted dithiol-disulfide oxidoreductase (DUF899 family)
VAGPLVFGERALPSLREDSQPTALSDGVVYHTYSSYAPESNFMVFYGQLLERTPKGADEGVQTRRHDEY